VGVVPNELFWLVKLFGFGELFGVGNRLEWQNRGNIVVFQRISTHQLLGHSIKIIYPTTQYQITAF